MKARKSTRQNKNPLSIAGFFVLAYIAITFKALHLSPAEWRAQE